MTEYFTKSVILAKDGLRWMLKAGYEGKRSQNSFWYLRKAHDIVLSSICILFCVCTGSVFCYVCMRKNVNFSQFLPACISGTARWKNLVPVSYCRATQELSNGGWNMGIHPGEPKRTTFCARHFFERLRIACTKTFTAELMDVSGL